MGTDIYTLVERQDEDGVWRVVPPNDGWSDLGDIEWSCRRDYDLFDMLAGGRSGDENMARFPPRGVPSDADQQTRDYFSVDTDPWLYQVSWWTLAELLAVTDWPEQVENKRFRSTWRQRIAQWSELGPPDRVRIVFGFD